MNTSHYASETMEQITVTHPDFPERKALLTRFKGERTWAVVGFYLDFDPIPCQDGPSRKFRKALALEMGERYVTRGWTTL